MMKTQMSSKGPIFTLRPSDLMATFVLVYYMFYGVRVIPELMRPHSISNLISPFDLLELNIITQTVVAKEILEQNQNKGIPIPQLAIITTLVEIIELEKGVII